MSRRLLLVLLSTAICALTGCGQIDQTKQQEVVCLYSDGAEHYEALCRLFIGRLSARLGDDYSFAITSTAEGENQLTGAMDILDAIASREKGSDRVYLGFTQADVAYYFRYGGHPLYPTPHSRKDEVVALARLYPEYLHLLASADPASIGGADTFPQIVDQLYLGSLGSGTLISSLNVLSTLAGLDLGSPGTVRRFFWDRSTATSSSWGGTLVAGLGQSRVSHLVEDLDVGLVSLSPEEQRHVRNAYSQFYSTKTLDAYGIEELTLLEIPALLAASKKLPAEVAEVLVAELASIDLEPQGELGRWRSELSVPQPGFMDSASDVSELSPEFIEALHRQLLEYKGERQGDLILSPHRATLSRRDDRGLWELTIALLAGLGAFFLGRSALRAHRESSSLLEISPWLTTPIALLVCIAWLHLSLFLVWRMDLALYMGYGTDTVSPFISSSYAELLPMVIHYIASVFSAEKLFPVSRLGQLVWLSIPVLMGMAAIVGVVHVAIPPAIGLIKKHLQEETTMELEGHFVICNWHPNGEEIIRQLQVQEKLAGRGEPTVVVISPEEDDVTLPRLGTRKATNLPEHTLFAVPPAKGTVVDESIMAVLGLRGNPQEEMTLRLARPERARTVIVFPDSKLENPDSSTVLTVLRLQEILGENSGVQTLVWCADSRNVEVFLDPRFELTDVCSSEWAWRVICQATRVSHVSNLYRHLMTSSADTNEFYEFQLPEGWPGGTFRELQESILRFNDNGCGEVEGHQGLVNTILPVGFVECSDHGRQDIHLNPLPSTKISSGDFLIFLTYVFDNESERHLEQFLIEESKVSN